MLVLEAQRLIREERRQRRVGGAARDPQDQERVPRARRRVLQGAARRRRLRRRARSSRTCSARRRTSTSRRPRARSSSRTTSRPPTPRSCSTSGRSPASSPTPATKTSHTAIVARALEVPAVVGVGRITALVDRGDWSSSTAAAASSSSTRRRASARDYEVARERWLAARAGAAPHPRPPGHARSDGVTRAARRQHRVRRGGPSLVAHGGEGVGPLPDRVPVPRPRRPAERGGAVPRTTATHPRGARAAAGDDPHVRPRRRQAAGRHAKSTPRTRRSACARSATACASPTCSARSCAALLRASVHGNLRDHVPDDLRGRRAARGEAACSPRCRDELRARGRADVAMPPVGIMIELPSRGDASPTGSRGSATSSPSARTTSSSTRWRSTGRTRTSPTSTSRSTSRCCGC